MHKLILLILLSFIYAADAVNIVFPQPLVAVENNDFSWTRSEGDPKNFYLVKQKLDDPGGVTAFSEKIDVVAGDSQAGKGNIYFRRAGLFRVVVFTRNNREAQRALFSTTVTVSLNPTSIGALTQTHTPAAPLPSPTSKSHSGQQRPSVSSTGAIAGAVIGVVALVSLTVTVFFLLRRRNRLQNIDALIVPFPDIESGPTRAQKGRMRSPGNVQARPTRTPTFLALRDYLNNDRQRTRGAEGQIVVQHGDSGWRPLGVLDMPPQYDTAR
ncbi:hypothetical protein WG66_008278 [Moniliophthora roreri]|nr:hypothetical protein WG66_008278 [Moniliophthora roreri]